MLQIDSGFIPIMVTAYEDVERVVKAMKMGAFDYITKPFDFAKVWISIEKGFGSLPDQARGETPQAGAEPSKRARSYHCHE